MMMQKGVFGRIVKVPPRAGRLNSDDGCLLRWSCTVCNNSAITSTEKTLQRRECELENHV